MRPDRLASLFGFANAESVVIVTDRGTQIPIGRDCPLTVLELHQVLAEIDALPEVEPESRRA